MKTNMFNLSRFSLRRIGLGAILIALALWLMGYRKAHGAEISATQIAEDPAVAAQVAAKEGGPKVISGAATKVKCWTFFVSLPDANRATNTFPVARDVLMAGLKLGGKFDNRGREASPTGLAFQKHFDSGDVTTSTNQHLWRFQFAPTNAFAGEWGNRGYCVLIAQGLNGKVNIDQLSWEVVGGIVSGARSLRGLGYNNTTRVGVNAGADGVLWTPDDTFVTSGAGTLWCDAILYIGASLASPNANDASDQTKINDYFGNGLQVEVKFMFDAGLTNPIVCKAQVNIYGMGQVPSAAYNFWPLPTPYGFLYSLVQPAGQVYQIGRTSAILFPHFPIIATDARPGYSIPEVFLNGNSAAFFSLQRTQ